MVLAQSFSVRETIELIRHESFPLRILCWLRHLHSMPIGGFFV